MELYNRIKINTSLKNITFNDKNNIERIGNCAFAFTKIKSFISFNYLNYIGDYAFSECSSLQSLTIPISVTSIGDYAFFSCSNLRSISIPHILGFLISKIFPQTPLFEIVILPIFILDRGTA